MGTTLPGSTGACFDSLNTGVAIIGENNSIVYANPPFARLINESSLRDSIGESVRGSTSARLEFAKLFDDKLRNVGASTLELHLDAGAVVTLYIGARDNSLRVIVAMAGASVAADSSISLAGRLDPLTGFGNRLMYDETIRLLKASDTGDSSIAVLVVDLDNFKQVNDTLGHGTGDELLILVARRIRKSTRSADTLVRLGGDEFAVVLEQGLGTAEASVLGERLVALLGQPFLVQGHQINIGASVGIAALGETTHDAVDLLRHADLALYEAKGLGRSRYAIFEARLEQRAIERRDFETDLRRALGLRQFSLFYQPQTSIAENRVSGFEALIRWEHPSRGRVSPDDFIPLAEEIGEITNIGSWVIRSACEEAMRWIDQTLSVAVNVSPVQFGNDDLVEVIRSALHKSGLAPERLEIEITEGLLLNKSKDVMKRLWAIKDLGVAIAMDDFGTGYASLSFLNSFPFSKIKIDKSFIQADCSPRSKALVNGILSMGASLGMITIAEGVETLEQYSEVAKGGCGIAQGYYIAKPMPALEIPGFLDSFAYSIRSRPKS